MTHRTAIAVVLSILIPGLGQIYLGQVKRGILLIIAGFGIGVVASFLLPFPYSLIVSGVYWGWNVWDAYKLAKKQEASKKESFDKGWTA